MAMFAPHKAGARVKKVAPRDRAWINEASFLLLNYPGGGVVVTTCSICFDVA